MKKSFLSNKWLNLKQMIGILCIVVGIAALIYAIHSANRVSSAREDVDKFTGFFSKNPVTEFGKKSIGEKLDEYDAQIRILFIGGLVFILGGAGTVFYFRKKK